MGERGERLFLIGLKFSHALLSLFPQFRPRIQINRRASRVNLFLYIIESRVRSTYIYSTRKELIIGEESSPAAGRSEHNRGDRSALLKNI